MIEFGKNHSSNKWRRVTDLKWAPSLRKSFDGATELVLFLTLFLSRYEISQAGFKWWKCIWKMFIKLWTFKLWCKIWRQNKIFFLHIYDLYKNFYRFFFQNVIKSGQLLAMLPFIIVSLYFSVVMWIIGNQGWKFFKIAVLSMLQLN